MQMSKLNSLLEATSWSDKKDTFDLTIGCVQKLFLELRRLNHTISTSVPPTGMCYCPSDVSATYRYVLLLFRCQHHLQVDVWPPLNDFILWYPPQKVLHMLYLKIALSGSFSSSSFSGCMWLAAGFICSWRWSCLPSIYKLCTFVVLYDKL